MDGGMGWDVPVIFSGIYLPKCGRNKFILAFVPFLGFIQVHALLLGALLVGGILVLVVPR
jgi:hypothetical protein